MTTQELVGMLLFTANEMKSHTEELCKLDSYIGDGDHGMTIERGFKAVEEILEGKSFDKPVEVLKAVGDAFMNVTGGAIGPILGSFFRGGSKKLADVEEMNTDAFQDMLVYGLKQIKLIGEAKEGDRTMVDALSPAASAFTEANARGESLSECFCKAAEAAKKGAEETKNMVAQKGRARFLGEKSLGYVDAGAVSMSLILYNMSTYIQNNNLH